MNINLRNLIKIIIAKQYQPNYSINPIICINWDGEPSGYAENSDYWIFLGIKPTRCTNFSNLFLE